MAVHPGARFSEPAELYDLVYGWKDYAREADVVRALLHDAGVLDGARVLEGACGTGTYLAPLARHFEVAGFDLDGKMLEVARRKLGPRASLFRADLADFTLAQGGLAPQDAVIVLFGGVGYVHPLPRLEACARAIHAALRPGGVALIEPWDTPDDFQADRPFMQVVDTPFLKVARQCVTRREGDLSILEFHFLVARPGFPVEHKVERNALYLYETDAVIGAFEAAGFAVERLDAGFLHAGRLLRCRRSVVDGTGDVG